MSASAILILSSSLTLLLAAPGAGITARDFTPQEVDLIVAGHAEQVEMLKWIGGIMVVSLASAVGFLIRELLRSHRVLVNEVRTGASERANLAQTLGHIAQLLHDKPCLHERYLQGLAEQNDDGDQA